MRKKSGQIIVIFTLFMMFMPLLAISQEIPAYFKVASRPEPIDQMAQTVKTSLETNGFEIIGEYSPEDKEGLKVIVYTRDDLKKITFNVKDRGALAAALKIGFMREESQTIISMLNPSYLFYGYLRENISDYTALLDISDDARKAMQAVGTDFEPFGGKVKLKKLMKYHYMMAMPYFDDPVELKEFTSFEEGLETIRKNLKEKTGSCVKVYELIDSDKQIAVFGVGLYDGEKGESNFLPIIGEAHIAAMPFELILQGNNATMLHGRFRIALHWPDLTMGTFTKIMSTPGAVEDYMKALTE